MARSDNYSVKEWTEKTAWKWVSSKNTFVIRTPDGKVKEARNVSLKASKSFLMRVIESTPRYVMRGKI